MGLYTPTSHRTISPPIFVPKQQERESSITSTDPRYDPNDVMFHNPLLDPRYLAFLLRPVYQRVRNPDSNFFSSSVVPVERIIYAPWYKHPDPIVHLEDFNIYPTHNDFYIQPTMYREDHRGCILGYTPTVADLFPTGQGDIFSLFFLKEDVCYPWLWSVGLQVARNKSRFRNAWLRGEVDYGKEFPGRFFRSLSFIQMKFAKFVIDITDNVINPAAAKIAVCNRKALASQLALGVDEHGDWILSQDFWQYFTDTNPTGLPHESFLSHTLRPRRG